MSSSTSSSSSSSILRLFKVKGGLGGPEKRRKRKKRKKRKREKASACVLKLNLRTLQNLQHCSHSMKSWPSTSSRSVMSLSRTNVLQMGVNNMEPYNMAIHGKVEGKPSDHDDTLTGMRHILLPILIIIECDEVKCIHSLCGLQPKAWLLGLSTLPTAPRSISNNQRRRNQQSQPR